MKNEYTTGIDIGTHSIKIIIAEEKAQNSQPRILYATESPSHGFRNGYIIDIDAASNSLAVALKKIETNAKIQVEQARFSISGIGLSSQYVRTSIDISKRDDEITDSHIAEVIQKSEQLFLQKYPNKKIIHIIPIKYLVDGRDVLGNPVGMYGGHLEVKIVFITILEHHYDSFASLAERNSIIIQDLIASPLADAEISASYKQKSQGCVIVNIGSETSSITTFENGLTTSLKVIPIGSNDITNDIALGMQTSLEIAEAVKLLKNKDYPKNKTTEIIHARLSDILETTEHHLISLRKNRLLPAGIIFSGGGSNIEFIEEYAKKILHLPAEKISIYRYSKKTKRNTNIGSQYSVAYGLCFMGDGHQPFKKQYFNLKNIKKSILDIIKQITP